MDFSKLYCIIDEQTCADAGVDVLKCAEFFVNKGVPFLQYRNKIVKNFVDQNDVDFLQFKKNAWALRQLTWGTSTKFILNDFVEMAYLVDADGVHLGIEDFRDLISSHDGLLSCSDVDAYYGDESRLEKKMMYGISTHTVEQAAEVQKFSPSYIGVGPLYDTPTKSSVSGIGREVARQMVEASKVSTVVIGGIDENNYAEVMEVTGATFFAMVRGAVSLYKNS